MRRKSEKQRFRNSEIAAFYAVDEQKKERYNNKKEGSHAIYNCKK